MLFTKKRRDKSAHQSRPPGRCATITAYLWTVRISARLAFRGRTRCRKRKQRSLGQGPPSGAIRAYGDHRTHKGRHKQKHKEQELYDTSTSAGIRGVCHEASARGVSQDPSWSANTTFVCHDPSSSANTRVVCDDANTNTRAVCHDAHTNQAQDLYVTWKRAHH